MYTIKSKNNKINILSTNQEEEQYVFNKRRKNLFITTFTRKLQADFEELTTEELEECRLCMFNRVSECLEVLGESEEDIEIR